MRNSRINIDDVELPQDGRRLLVADSLWERIDSEEKHRRIFAQICIIISLPILVAFGIEDLGKPSPAWESGPNFVTALLLMGGGIAIRKITRADWLLRGLTGTVMLLLLTDMSRNVNGVADSLWMFIFPLFAVQLFALTEGIIWSLIAGASAVFVTFAGNAIGAYNYDTDFAMRYATSMAMVLGFAYATESLRRKFWVQLKKQRNVLNQQNQLLEHKTLELETALHEVKTLSGLLPICSNCKSVRDDRGYWHRIEQYLLSHTDAQFSHGICASCLKTQQPEIYKEMLEHGEVRDSQCAPPPPNWVFDDQLNPPQDENQT